MSSVRNQYSFDLCLKTMDVYLNTIIIGCLLVFVSGRYISDRSQLSSSLRRRRSELSSSPYHPHILLNNDEYFKRKYYNTLDNDSEEDGGTSEGDSDSEKLNNRRASASIYKNPIVVVPFDRPAPKAFPTVNYSTNYNNNNNKNNNNAKPSPTAAINTDIIKRIFDQSHQQSEQSTNDNHRYSNIPRVAPTKESYNNNRERHYEEEPYSHPKYEYKYSVNDVDYLDVKSHREQRDGDRTIGEYSVLQPDGTILTVTYTVNGDEGFKAIVSKSDVHKNHKRHIPKHKHH